MVDEAIAQTEEIQETKDQAPENGSMEQGKEVFEFDPRKPNRLTKRQLSNLRNLFDVFADNLASHLGEDLRMDMQIGIRSIAQERYENYVSVLPNPSILYEVDFAPMATPSLIVLQHGLVFSALDRLLGGTGEVIMEARDLTEVESGIGDRLVEGVAASFAAEWTRIEALTPSIKDRMTDPNRIAITTDSNEIILVIVMEISGGDSKFGMLTLSIPFSSIQEYIGKINVLDESSKPTIKGIDEWQSRINESIVKVDVGLPVVLGEAEISVQEILDLQADDVIVLDKKISDPVEAPLGKKGVIKGNVGVHNGHLALKIISVRQANSIAGDQEINKESSNG